MCFDVYGRAANRDDRSTNQSGGNMPKALGFVIALLAGLLAAGLPRDGAGGLSEQAGAGDRAVRAGRPERRDRPHHRRRSCRRTSASSSTSRTTPAAAATSASRSRRARRADGYTMLSPHRAFGSIPAPSQASPTTRSRISSPITLVATTPNVAGGASVRAGEDRQGAGRADPQPLPDKYTLSPIPASARRRTCPANCSSMRMQSRNSRRCRSAAAAR